ncbi:hypothetical protein GCM10011492_01660 [Flexivirga endophytica]|uniref:Uncharacterized protein n=1 Tax=Flexivirga endophytica TaxID=1849103 RepID=A0A916STK2_9MICO|nr:hypothetical protein [Flexivirga endophytica]GGB15645.1 hypothetical protein GCM10011492_01660 [Flexivirga endophytica]GHB39952.1 hypothetical protein GCM10008112_05960 [Flexivirga endophytica]
MPWTTTYEFGEDFEDLRRDRKRASAFEQELVREVSAGHPLHGRSWTVIALAFAQDEVVVESDDEVALVHLTWRRGPEPLPWPSTEFFTSAKEFGAATTDRY